MYINGKAVVVTASGILVPSSGFGGLFVNPNNAVIMDIGAYFTQVNPSRTFNLMVIQVDSPGNIGYVINQLKALFPTATVFNPESIVSSVNQFITGVQLFLALISGIGLFIVGLWIFDTMTISVIQRTREFGIMRAVGFTGTTVLLLLIIEAALIAILGSAVGTGLLLLTTSFVRTLPLGPFQLRLTLTPRDAALLFLIPIIINILATLGPAIRAMRITPAQVLRYE
jgi:putative ABC transport system permease protein